MSAGHQRVLSACRVWLFGTCATLIVRPSRPAVMSVLQVQRHQQLKANRPNDVTCPLCMFVAGQVGMLQHRLRCLNMPHPATVACTSLLLMQAGAVDPFSPAFEHITRPSNSMAYWLRWWRADPSECCWLQVKQQMADPAFQDNIRDASLAACAQLPAGMMQEACNTFVEEYGGSLISPLLSQGKQLANQADEPSHDS